MTRGFVHGDAFPDNTLFHHNKLIGIIDFEEACTDFCLFDIGITINGFCIFDNRLDYQLLHTFLSGYETIRHITENEFDILKYYIHWGAHAMIYWHMRNNLLYRENPAQVDRIHELIERIKSFKLNDQEIDNSIECYKNNKNKGNHGTQR